MNNIHIDKPSDWIDQSMIAYCYPETPENGIAPNIVVTQGSYGSDDIGTQEERIKSFATRQLSELQSKLPNLQLHQNQPSPSTVAERSSAEIHISWPSAQVRITQQIIFIAKDDERVVIVTSTAAEADFPNHQEEFSRIVSAMHFDA